ncbi:MAG: hypothetical protein K2Y32_13025 [Candidatus Obscuribacterales bacterium]|nr:hypothetical protein [Candidatus Obscuribacterales bacterium]
MQNFSKRHFALIKSKIKSPFPLDKQIAKRQLELAAAEDNAFNCELTSLNALETAGINEPLAAEKVSATSKETKAMMAPYSVIP